MVNPIDVFLLFDLEIIHPIDELLLGLRNPAGHAALSLFILPTHLLDLLAVSLLDLLH